MPLIPSDFLIPDEEGKVEFKLKNEHAVIIFIIVIAVFIILWILTR